MKKNIILSLISLIALTGCTPIDGGNKVSISYGSTYDQEKVELTYAELRKKVDNEESFLLALHPGQLDTIRCTCWKTFSYELDKYVQTNLPIVYSANIYEITEKAENFGLSDPAGEDPGFAIFEKGTLNKQFFYNSKQGFWGNKDAFKEMIEKRINQPKIIYIDDTKLDEVKAGHNQLVTFVRKSCSDCAYVLPNNFEPYFNNINNNKLLYAYDLEDLGYYKKEMSEDEQTAYNNKKASLGLTSASNSNYGYGTGVVPTTFVYDNNQIIDGNVFFNDSIEQRDDKWYVSQSYYDGVRPLHYVDGLSPLVNMEIDAQYIGDYYGYKYWKSENAAIYHAAFLNAFLEMYAKN